MKDDTDTKKTDPAEARKRRKAIITSQRDEVDNEMETETDSSEPKKRKADDAPPHHNKGKKKTQVRYDPSVPMNKDQLAAWRREARRVRNRESAAASRQRIRSKINELEDELDEWKDKYEKAMERLKSLEQTKKSESI
ncbi:hypothetical protein FisN_23Lh024 [Fistulifera solaris]|uniref:BZIP domain-containing protein n=1 Tax=Fistulifera solaris TaxID=1519565 RepID=A0A1Z5KJP0_FISSO|nr:hypothetical protein FisN_23Lh024 [Fistulifera solaris]|eukprot:GAX26499.1 hypothetical protein FisN_23Lh024 [Fistulifera solaris]